MLSSLLFGLRTQSAHGFLSLKAPASLSASVFTCPLTASIGYHRRKLLSTDIFNIIYIFILFILFPIYICNLLKYQIFCRVRRNPEQVSSVFHPDFAHFGYFYSPSSCFVQSNRHLQPDNLFLEESNQLRKNRIILPYLTDIFLN